jgi:membrane-associated phospholipid phosphatase
MNDSEGTINFFRFIYHLGEAKYFFIVTMVMFNLMSRQTSFYFASVISLCVFVEANFQLLIRQGRPYMMNRSIYPFICELSFGNPSGEALMSTAFFLAVALYYLQRLRD